MNVLTSMLTLLNVKFTSAHANKYFNEHPHKYNLFGLSNMLTYYGVQSMGVRIDHKEDIYSLDCPFIAHIGNDFVAVHRVSADITYYWREKRLTIPINDFFSTWTGVALLTEVNEVSIEPDYKQHKKEELVNSAQKILLFLAGITLVGIGFWQSNIYYSLGLTLLLISNLTGVLIGYLLVQKQVNTHSSMADKICSLFAHNDCNDVLNSPAAKFMGVIGWSELGFSYFLSNTFILLFAPHLIFYFVLISICVLPYSFWSIWYQRFRARTWCPLCLIVQLLFWFSFITSSIFSYIHFPQLTVMNILSIALIYGIPFLAINLILPHQIAEKKLTEVTQQFNSLKMNEKVFLGLLKEQTYYEIDKDISTIIFGNPHAKNTITVFSNPHCEPCTIMHKRIEKLLIDTNNQFRIQYILSSFDESVNSSCEFFFYVNQKYLKKERNRIYNEWFDKGKYDKENFFKEYSFTAENNISEEFQKHLEWKRRRKLQATPTVIFNGYELPEMFFQQIEKLAFFTDLEVDPK